MLKGTKLKCSICFFYFISFSVLSADERNVYDYQERYDNQSDNYNQQPIEQRIYTGPHHNAYHDLDYYPRYYNDPDYYYNPREEYGKRMGNWDYRNKWHYNRKAYYQGHTQPSYYRERHPYGPGGVGYDPDEEYLHLYDRVGDDHAMISNLRKKNSEVALEKKRKNERARSNPSNYSYENPRNTSGNNSRPNR